MQLRSPDAAPSAFDVIAQALGCQHCIAGLAPVKMKRQVVHHFPASGRIVICVDRVLKPGRLAAASNVPKDA